MEIYRNLRGEEIEQIILEKGKDSKNQMKEYNSLIVCILSHGSSGVIYGSDFKKVFIETLLYAFNSLYCPSLHNKPKIFIIEACRVDSKGKNATTDKEHWFVISPFCRPIQPVHII